MLVEFSVIAITGADAASQAVADAVDLVHQSGLPYRLGPSSTCVEGEWDEVVPLLRRCLEAAHRNAADVVLQVKIQDSPGRTNLLDSNVRDVERALEERQSTAAGVDAERKVEEADLESFPASDAPGWRS